MIINAPDGTLVQIDSGTARTVKGIVGHVTKSGKGWAARPTTGKLSTHSTRKDAVQHLIDNM